MWIEFIRQLEPEAEFAEGASAERLTELEQALRVALPSDLRSLLSESDGVYGEYGLHLIWSSDEIEAMNRQRWDDSRFRATYMPLDSLLFFADAGDGEMFALGIIEGIIQRPDVYVWNPIDDSRTWTAPTIRQYLEWWLTGKINL
ncbi:MAG TPA: SMI1/KNR4 family protein [Ktedonobacterales bacterium]|nr:SMI1/KNR4 family protein [Ktedonobacterales bacterium]